MRFPDPLIPARLIRRYKRFLADVVLEDGTETTAHCANPGAMTGLDAQGSEIWLSPARNPARKLRYSWELIRTPTGLVGINTAHPNRIVEEAIGARTVAEVADYDQIRREVPYGRNSRIDLLLSGTGLPNCYLEVKNVHLRRNGAADHGLAEFPDAVTKRGAKHLKELGDMVEAGHRAVMLYLVQRDDCAYFDLARDIDPGYAEAFGRARSRGVEALCYDCRLSTEEITLARRLPIGRPGQ